MSALFDNLPMLALAGLIDSFSPHDRWQPGRARAPPRGRPRARVASAIGRLSPEQRRQIETLIGEKKAIEAIKLDACSLAWTSRTRRASSTHCAAPIEVTAAAPSLHAPAPCISSAFATSTRYRQPGSSSITRPAVPHR